MERGRNVKGEKKMRCERGEDTQICRIEKRPDKNSTEVHFMKIRGGVFREKRQRKNGPQSENRADSTATLREIFIR